MRLLLHIGLNKCASTYIQDRLAANRPRLAAAGVFYGDEGGQTCHYGLSRHYGFGPEADGVAPRPLGWHAARARRRSASAVIVSSEYLSLARPQAAARLVRDAAAEGFAPPEVLLFARPVEAWVRSLFNQYVRTAEGAAWLPSIDAFVDQVLANRAIDLAARHRAWADAAGAERIRIVDIGAGDPPGAVLRPFARFADVALADHGGGGRGNRGLPPGALYLTGLVRCAPRSTARDRLLGRIERLGQGLGPWVPVPPGYLRISPDRRERLAREVAAPFAALPRRPATAASPA